MSAIISTWLVTYLMHSTLLIVVVALAAPVVRSASVRDTLWKIALLGGILTATLQTAIPADVPQRVTVRMQDSGVRQPELPLSKAAAMPPHSTYDPTTFAYAGYAAIALLLLGRLVIGRNRFLATIGDRIEIVSGATRTLLDDVAERMRIARPVRLSESRSIASPVAMLGWEIVLPAEGFARLTEEQRETILAHELGHLVRRDPLWLTVAEAIKALLFFQPLNWLIPSKMKETAEFLCDDAAVLQTGNQQALAETLAELASRVTPSTPAVAAMAEGGSNLIVRVTRVLRARPRVPVHLSVRMAMALSVVVLTALFAPAFGIVRAAASAKPERIKQLTKGGTVNYFADGELGQTYNGPDGRTRVQLHAHEVQVSDDGKFIHFVTPDGYLRVTTRAENGTKREIEITPNTDLSPRYRYVVNGEEKAWCDDARRAMVSAFRAEDAYADRQSPQMHTWNGNIHLTGSKDGEPTEIRISIVDIRYDDAGNIDIGRGSSIDVYERVGTVERSYDLRYEQTHFRGSWDDDVETREDWLRRLLAKETNANKKLIESILEY